MLDGIDRVRLQVLQRDGQVSYAELGGQRREPEFLNRMRARPEGLESQCTHSIIALSFAKEIREIDTTVPGTGQ